MKDRDRMARPRKDPADALTESLPSVRVSRSDRAKIEAKAAKAGLPVSAYLRRVAVTGKVTITNQLDGSVADAETLAALARSGNNLNQLAHHLNRGGEVPPAFEAVLHQHFQILEKLSRRL